MRQTYAISGSDIVKDTNPKLREKCESVVLPPTTEDKKLLEDMLEFLENSQTPKFKKKHRIRSSLGMSANQIGIQKRAIAIAVKGVGKTAGLRVAMFNPKIIERSEELIHLASGEHCISVDVSQIGIVHRNARVVVRGYDIEGIERDYEFKGLIAICVQHEIDHLDGILYYDLLDKKFNPHSKKDLARSRPVKIM